MRYAFVQHIVSLLLACAGTAVLLLDPPGHTDWFLGAGLLSLAFWGASTAIRSTRRRWLELSNRKLRATEDLEARVRELESRLTAAALQTDQTETAIAAAQAGVDPLIALADAPEHSTAARCKPVRQPPEPEHLLRLISHEARTPLTTMNAYSELLLDGEPLDEATRRDFFSIIHTETERLAGVLDSLLNLTRIDAGTMPVQRQRLSLNALAARVVHASIGLADLRRVAIDTDLAAPTDTVWADPDLMLQATRNLLAHVTKSTEPGGRVLVRSQYDPRERKVSLQITGNRTGIPPKDVPSALDSFYGGSERCEEPVPPGAASLAFARRVVETVHEGTPWVSAHANACTLGFVLAECRDESSAKVDRAEPTAEVNHV